MKVLPYYSEDCGAKFAGAISLNKNIEAISEPDANLISTYINSSIVIDEWLSNTKDIMTNKLTIPTKAWSDGVYVWDSSHSHYVKEYRARLPDAFIAHVKHQISSGFNAQSLNKAHLYAEFEKILKKLAAGDESFYDGSYSAHAR